MGVPVHHLQGERLLTGWPASSEVGNTNSSAEFVYPTGKAMGHAPHPAYAPKGLRNVARGGAQRNPW